MDEYFYDAFKSIGAIQEVDRVGRGVLIARIGSLIVWWLGRFSDAAVCVEWKSFCSGRQSVFSLFAFTKIASVLKTTSCNTSYIFVATFFPVH